MSIRTGISAVAVALAALFLVAFAPTGAAAHGSVPHAHAVKHASDSVAVGVAAEAVPAELRSQPATSPNDLADTTCGDRGCCSAGHCSGCGTALPPGTWTCLQLPSDVVLLNPDASLPASLAREGPARPPKSFA